MQHGVLIKCHSILRPGLNASPCHSLSGVSFYKLLPIVTTPRSYVNDTSWHSECVIGGGFDIRGYCVNAGHVLAIYFSLFFFFLSFSLSLFIFFYFWFLISRICDSSSTSRVTSYVTYLLKIDKGFDFSWFELSTFWVYTHMARKLLRIL